MAFLVFSEVVVVCLESVRRTSAHVSDCLDDSVETPLERLYFILAEAREVPRTSSDGSYNGCVTYASRVDVSVGVLQALYKHGVCKWPGCDAPCDSKYSFARWGIYIATDVLSYFPLSVTETTYL